MLFARNVRSLMADRLGVPISDWTREIGFLYEELINLDLPVDLLAFDYFDMTKETGLGFGFNKLFVSYKTIWQETSERLAWNGQNHEGVQS